MYLIPCATKTMFEACTTKTYMTTTFTTTSCCKNVLWDLLHRKCMRNSVVYQIREKTEVEGEGIVRAYVGIWLLSMMHIAKRGLNWQSKFRNTEINDDIFARHCIGFRT